jgi:type I restriction enzyme S subunit
MGIDNTIDITPAQRKELLGLLSRHLPGTAVWAFGSRVKWTSRPDSDLDLVAFSASQQQDHIAALKEALEESSLPFRVDLLVWDDIPESFRENIQRAYVVLVEEPAGKQGLGDGWAKLPLEDCMAAIIDYRGKSPNKTTFGVPLITAKVVKGGRIETPDEFIAETDYEDWMSRGIPQAGDVVMTTEAPLGEVAQLDGRKVALAQRIITLRGKPGILDQSFLKFLLQSQSVQEELRSRATGTTVVGIRQSELRKVNLTLPPYESQKCIGHILGTLDDKIELNRRMNETLEAMARAIFQSWFVDFDPVRAKTNGESADAICQRLGLTPELLALFPDSFEDSELGEIPKGWSVGTLGELASNPKRGIQPDKISPTTPYIALEHMPRRSIALSDWGYGDGLESNKFEFQKGEILFGKLRPYFHKVGVAPLAGVCSTDILVVAPNSEVWLAVVLGHVSSVAFVEHTNAGSTGTKMPRTSWKEMSAYRITLPTSAIAKKYNDQISPMLARINSAIFESKSLCELRDGLLPKLLSGSLLCTSSESICEHA